MKREIRFSPAFDERDADPKKNYGIHGVDMQWYVIGEEGAIQFIVHINWHLPHVQRELMQRAEKGGPFACLSLVPMVTDVGYHAKVPQFEGQYKQENCKLTGGDCYYDESGLYAEEMFQLLIEKGDEAVWLKLEEEYIERFRRNNEEN